jgi:hypothetical protein
MNPDERIAQINKTLEAIQNGWPFFLALLNEQIAAKTEELINNDNEQTRGAIKALRGLTGMPDMLAQERGWLSAAELPETDSAN